VSEHAQGLTRGYTFTRRPVKLVFSERYERIVDAIAVETRIKGWSRAKKEASHARRFLDARCAFKERLETERLRSVAEPPARTGASFEAVPRPRALGGASGRG
jgi:putative endonuclease